MVLGKKESLQACRNDCLFGLALNMRGEVTKY